jgi:hypothetical protein
MFYRSWRNAAERMYIRLRSRHLVQAFTSRHSLRRDVSTAMIYNPKDRSIPLPSLRMGRQETSCLNFCKTVESIMRTYHGVDGGCSRGESRACGGFTSHSGRFATAGRESDYGASPQATSRVGQSATRGASPKPTARNAQHQWLMESHIRPAVGSLPTGQAAAVQYIRPSRGRWRLCLTKRRSFRRD